MAEPSSRNIYLAAIEQSGILRDVETHPRGYRLIHPGETERYVYFIESGAFRVFFEHEDEEYITRLAYSGDLITALDSFLKGGPTTFYIEALRSSKIRRALKTDYLDLIHANPELQAIWEELLNDLVFQQLERERDLLIPSPQERFDRVMKRSPKLFAEVPLKYIAAYLRMTPETLSRIMNS